MFYSVLSRIVGDMHIHRSLHRLHCHRCDQDYVVGLDSITSVHTTSEGRLAYVRCPHGHRLVRLLEPHPRAPAEVPAPSQTAA